MFDRSDKLVGFDDATSMSGTLQYVQREGNLFICL
jgi:hypothetical protein